MGAIDVVGATEYAREPFFLGVALVGALVPVVWLTLQVDPLASEYYQRSFSHESDRLRRT
jgi:hypothetical protein